MLRRDRQSEDEAIAWVIRLRDADEADWTAFEAWLEADPAHAAAYDEAALADQDAGSLPPVAAGVTAVGPALVAPPPRRGLGTRRVWLGWAAAASVVLTAGLSLGLAGGDRIIETAPGERRMVALADGSRIALNGGSRLALDSDRPRYARLEEGEALFEIVHDSRRPFEVDAAGARLVDLGTIFNVRSSPGSLEVAVSEGIVIYEPDREARTLRPGMALRRRGMAPAEVAPVPIAAVGGWREDRLVYSGATVEVVAADLARNLGVPVAADPAVATAPFSGVIRLDGSNDEVLARSAAVLGLTLRRSGAGWTLTRARAGR